MIFKQPIIILPQNKIKPIKQKVEIKLFKRKTIATQQANNNWRKIEAETIKLAKNKKPIKRDEREL